MYNSKRRISFIRLFSQGSRAHTHTHCYICMCKPFMGIYLLFNLYKEFFMRQHSYVNTGVCVCRCAPVQPYLQKFNKLTSMLLTLSPWMRSHISCITSVCFRKKNFNLCILLHISVYVPESLVAFECSPTANTHTHAQSHILI